MTTLIYRMARRKTRPADQMSLVDPDLRTLIKSEKTKDQG
jgi:hypothetical protein